MDWQQFILIITELGITPLNIILVVMVVILMNHLGISIKFWEKKDKSDKPATKSQVDYLTEYYNHDITAYLKNIDVNIEKMENSMNFIKDGIREIKQTHEEWDKYGVITRDKK